MLSLADSQCNSLFIVMMGFVSVVVVRYRLTLIPALCFMVFIAYRVHSIAKANPAASRADMASPMMIGIGLLLMYRGRTVDNPWSWTFWAGKFVFVHSRVNVVVRCDCVNELNLNVSL